MVDFNTFAEQSIQGIWQLQPNHTSLVFTVGTSDSLQAHQVVLANNNLHPDFKVAIIKALGPEVLANVVGPFGDEDIFSGYDQGDITTYYLELNQVGESNIEALKAIPGVILRRYDENV